MQNVKKALAITLAILTAGTSFAQVAEQPIAPVVTDLAQLPAIQSLEKNIPGWTALDTDVALSLVRTYITQKNKGMPVDCRFNVSDLFQKKFRLNETGAKAENQVRRYGQPVVAFAQYNILKDFPETAEGFNPTRKNDEQWVAFERDVLPGLTVSIRSAYQGANPGGMTSLVLNGFQRVCGDIKRYMTIRFRADPTVISCVSEDTFSQTTVESFDRDNVQGSTTTVKTTQSSLNFYRLTYPFAEGYQYRKLKLESCAFEVAETRTEEALTESEDQLGRNETQTKVKSPGLRSKDAQREKIRAEREASNAEKQQARENLKVQREEVAAARVQANLERLDALPFRPNGKGTYFSAPEHGTPREVVARTEYGKLMRSSYKELHNKVWSDQAQFDRDSVKIEPLIEQIKEKEYTFTSKKGTAPTLKTSEKFQSIKLDPKKPFDLISIPVDYPIDFEQLEGVVRNLESQNYGWLMGCLPRSYVEKNRQGDNVTVRTMVDCLTPRFLAKRANPNKGYMVGIPVPLLLKAEQAVTQACGESKGSVVSTGPGLGMGKVNLFKLPARQGIYYPTHGGTKIRNIPKEIPLYGGFGGRILDLFTKKPILSATAIINNFEGAVDTKTDIQGEYTFPEVRLKGLMPNLLGKHRLYYDNSLKIQNVMVGEVSRQEDLYLDPKRVSLSGTIGETFKPKYGSGIRGLKVEMTGYPQFNAITDENGNYTLHNVPASLDSVSVVDPKKGHQDLAFAVALSADEPNVNINGKMVPILTTIKGHLQTPKGRSIPGLAVSLQGYPEYTAVSDDAGNFEFKDLPVQIAAIQVVGDSENIYDSKTEALTAPLQIYADNQKTVVLKYNRSDVSGRVYDVISKEPISGVKVWVEGAKQKYFAVTDSSGYYEITKVPDTARRLNVEIDGNKYIARSRAIDPLPTPGKDVEDQDFRLVPREYTVNKIVFVVTWNDKQYDLDSQLFFPNGKHLYFKTLGDNSFSTEGGGYLDRDDTGNNGRETTIVSLDAGKTKLSGAYRFLVFQYSYSGLSFEEAGAKVEIYRDGEFWQEVKPGDGRGRLWYVGNVTDDNVRMINDFPAAELYEKMDVFQKELKRHSDQIGSERQMLTSLEAQLESAVPAEASDRALLETKRAELAALNAPAPVVPGAPPAPVAAKVDPKPLKEEIAKIKKRIDGYPALVAKLPKDIAQKKALLEKIEAQHGKRDAEIQAQLQVLDQKLNEILQAYH